MRASATIGTLNNTSVNLGATTALSVSAGTPDPQGGLPAPDTTDQNRVHPFHHRCILNLRTTGGTTIAAGALQLGNAGTAGSLVGKTSSIMARWRSIARIHGIHIFRKTSAAPAGLLNPARNSSRQTGTNGFAGSIAVNAGTLKFGSPAALPSGDSFSTVATASTARPE